ncbi:MAG: hypothetical protein ACLTZT_12995 [Butyricimonas faecalis]
MVTTYNGKVSVPEGDAISESVKANYRESVIEYFQSRLTGRIQLRGHQGKQNFRRK